jgi:hypothetical protein
MSEQQPVSSEPIYVKIKDGSDRVYRSFSVYELLKLEHAINESEPGHIKELHDAGNETIDKVRSRPFPDCDHCTKIEERPPENKYAEQIRAQEREQVLGEITKLTMMLDTNETELWERAGRPKNDGYINGAHSGYGHATRDVRQWVDRIMKAHSNGVNPK